MDVHGSIFPDPEAKVSVKAEEVGDGLKFFVNVGTLMLVLTEAQASQLRFEMAAELFGIEADNERT